MRRPWFRQPLVHFLVLGSLLFALEQWRVQRAAYQIEAPSEAFLRSAAQDVEQLQGRPLAPQQWQALREHELDQRVLFAEALRRELHLTDPVAVQRMLRNASFLGLEGEPREQLEAGLALDIHRGDEVIKRRLIQIMEAQGRALRPIAEPSEEALQALYSAAPESWMREASYSFRHVFVSADKPAPEVRAAAILAQLREGGSWQALGDGFLPGRKMSKVSPRQLQQTFGNSFAQWLEQLSPAELGATQWQGPVASAYGLHLVQMIDHRAAQLRPYSELRERLREQYLDQQRAAMLKEFVAELRSRYRVVSP